MTEEIPRNLIKTAGAPSKRDDAAIEAEWLANNVPTERLELHWRYESGVIQLYERRLRSLPSYGIGPALRSYLRTRLEWFSDNKLYAQPRGIIKVIVETNGDVDVQLGDAIEIPQLSDCDLTWEDGTLAGANVPGTLFVHMGDELVVVSAQPLRDACETFAADLVNTLSRALGYTVVDREVAQEDIADAEIALVNESMGLIVLEGHAGAVTSKLTQCFEKLWSKGK